MRNSIPAPPSPPARDAAAHRRGAAATRPVLVDCVVRSDAPVKSGGDSVQVEEYARHLAAWGVDVREVPFHPAMTLRPGAVVHVFNVDRPYEFLLACRAARGHRLVVSPIHHELPRVRAMRAADRGRGMVSLSARVLPEAVREWMATGYRAARGTRGRRELAASALATARLAPVVPAVWRAAGRALDRADAVALLAAGEGRHLREVTGWSAPNDLLVPNGRPEDLDLAACTPWTERLVGAIVVVGRVEPRKRQLELARAADRLRIPVRFIGPAAGSAYAAAFTALAESSPYVTWDGPMPRARVLEILGASRALVNASWVEVQSLVDLEAATMGCAVVTARTGHSAEWLGEAITVADGDDPEVLLRRAAELAAADAPAPVPPVYEQTWEQAARQLLAAYTV